MLRKLLIITLIVAAVGFNVSAEEGSTEQQITLSVFPTDIWAAKLSLEYTGLSLIPGQKTSLETIVTGGWLTQFSYYTGSYSNRLLPVSTFDDTNAEFKTAFVQNILGIRQGFIANSRNGKNLLEAFLYYKGRWEGHYPSGSNSPWFTSLTDNPEQENIFQSSFISGVGYNNSFRNHHGVIDGINADVRGEYAPSFMNSSADYYCFTGEIQGYLPLFDLNPESRMNTFSVYLADRVRTAYTDGSYRTYSIRLENAAEVRGIEKARLDSRFTAVNNFEIRFNLPSLFIPDIKPGLLTYFDAGYYYEDSSYSGTVMSTGAGLYVDLFGAFQGGVRYDYLIDGEKMDTERSSINMMFTFYF